MLGRGLLAHSVRRYSTKVPSKLPLTQCFRDIYQNSPPNETSLTVHGWVSGTRVSKKVAFVDVVDGTSDKDIKCVIKPPSLLPKELKVGSCVQLEGVWTEGKGTQKNELKITDADRIKVRGEVESLYPLLNKEHTDTYLRSIPLYRWRDQDAAAILRFRSKVESGLFSFFNSHSFTKTEPPILTSSDCEGAGEMFTVHSMSGDPKEKSFFGKETYLTVSTQLHLEVLCAALSRVWTLTPCFRAEKSDTNRHLSEFWMLEAEMAFVDRVSQLTDFSEQMIKHVVRQLLNNENEIASDLLGHAADKTQQETLKQRWEMLTKLDKWPSITYTKAVEILTDAEKQGKTQFQYKPAWGDSLHSEHEKWLAGEYFGSPVFVTDYPRDEKAFYMPLNKDGKTVACYDLLVPGIGELIGGSLRESDYSKLMAEIHRRKMNPEPLTWYLAQRKNGTFPHGGFGMGLERLLQYLTCKDNIKDMIAFPRTVNNCLC